MAKNSYSDWDTTAGNNTDVGGINIDENCAAANVNNAMREMMSQLATADLASMSDTTGRFLNVQTFTHASGNSTYTPTSGTKWARVIQQAAGGGGGNGGASTSGEAGAGAGGGAGALVDVILDVSAGSYSATVAHGAIGTGASTSGNPGTAAGDCSYDDTVTSWTTPGGTAGAGDNNRTATRFKDGSGKTAAPSVTQGANFVASIAEAAGAGSNWSLMADGAKAAPSSGASSRFGAGGDASTLNGAGTSAGTAGQGYGSGGGGGCAINSGNGNGGDGAPAITIILEYTE